MECFGKQPEPVHMAEVENTAYVREGVNVWIM